MTKVHSDSNNQITQVYERYGDIINLPRPKCPLHQPMSMLDRAAQFMPFDALTGLDEAIDETARLTDEELVDDEIRASRLNAQLHILLDNLKVQPQLELTYFIKDPRKSGGSYHSLKARLRTIDTNQRLLHFHEHAPISFEQILNIKCDLFD